MPSQADAVDRTELKKLDTSSMDCCGSSSETSSQEKSCGNGSIRNKDQTDDDNANAACSAQPADPLCNDPIDPHKGTALPEACEEGCCGDQPVSAVGKNIHHLGAFTANAACCVGNFATEAGMLSCNVSSDPTVTHTSSNTPRSSEHTTSVEPIVAECCQGKPLPCCDEACLDRLALRECHTGSTIPCMEAAGHCMLNGNGLRRITLLMLVLKQLFLRHPHRREVQRLSVEPVINTIAQLESSMLLSLLPWDVSAVLFLPSAKNHAASLESARRWVRDGALNGR